MKTDLYDVIVVGGGLAGLCNSIALSRSGLKVMVIEKKEYPFHRVCGEYISNEVVPYLNFLGINHQKLEPSHINRLMVSSPSGNIINLVLDLGGFGVSRFSLDYFLFQKAKEEGVVFRLNSKVTSIEFGNEEFQVHADKDFRIAARIVIGAFGKRSNLDKYLERSFFHHRSPYIAVKYHIRTDQDKDLIALHNFKDGYCGISAIEDEKYCLCYLSSRDNLRETGSIQGLEELILKRNPYLRYVFNNSDFLYESPLVINEVSFRNKQAVFDHILMSGDSAGMITPLCGNGMAMAIHSSKILSELILKFFREGSYSREQLEGEYISRWRQSFAKRMALGRNIQRLFGDERLTNMTIRSLKVARPVAHWLVRKTHGEPF